MLWYGLWFGRCAGFWFERGGRKRFVGEHANDEDGVAGADFVAVGESGFFDARSIEEGAVAALQVEKAAAFFTVFDGEVEAGHELVVGKDVIGFVGAADAESFASRYSDQFSDQASNRHVKDKFHYLTIPELRIVPHRPRHPT